MYIIILAVQPIAASCLFLTNLETRAIQLTLTRGGRGERGRREGARVLRLPSSSQPLVLLYCNNRKFFVLLTVSSTLEFAFPTFSSVLPPPVEFPPTYFPVFHSPVPWTIQLRVWFNWKNWTSKRPYHWLIVTVSCVLMVFLYTGLKWALGLPCSYCKTDGF